MNREHETVLQDLHNRLCALESGSGLCAHTRVQDLRGRSEKRAPRDIARRAKTTDRSEETAYTLAQRDRVLGEQREEEELRELADHLEETEEYQMMHEYLLYFSNNPPPSTITRIST